jgi:ABC-type multidrug transport system fused ATPase/permease subunit
VGFVLDGLETESYDRVYSDGDLVRRIWGYFRPHARRMFVVALTITFGSVAGTAGPILVSAGIDAISRAAATGAAAPVGRLTLLFTTGILGMGGLAWLANYVRQGLSARVLGDVVLALRDDVMAAVMRHDKSFFDEHPSGKIVSRITSDTQDFSGVVGLVVDAVSQFFLVALLAAWLATISLALTLLVLAMTPLAAVLALTFRHMVRKATRNARRVTARINNQVQESIAGIVVAKGFRQERALYDSFATQNAQAYRVGIRRGVIFNLIFPVTGMAAGIGSAALAYLGGMATRGGGISPGDWYLFMQAMATVWWPILSLASFWSQFQDGLSASERVFALIDAEPHVRQTGTRVVTALEGGIVLRRLTFGYRRAEGVLRDFSLEIEPREKLALVGHTGAGKSSIARLVARLYEFQEGELLVDGMDIRSLDLAGYRAHVGLVPQDPFLFSGTVRENIRYGRGGATDEDVARAAGRISDGEWIQDLPRGLDTEAGQRGAGLSMGQRQLVALARVLLQDPAILILDEATASVDPFTEVQIQEGLAELMRARTSIVIAHRLSTVRRADRIIVLEQGRILEAGTHDVLLAAGGSYATLYNTYFRHQSLEYVEQARTRAER